MTDPKKIQSLRDAWEAAVERDRPKDALAALEGLELLEPGEARWPHRKGDVLRRLGKAKEAEDTFVRAVRCYVAQGFLTRAAALAKTIVELNPARADVLGELHQAPAKKLREEVRPPASSPLNPRMPPPPRLPSGTIPAVTQPVALSPRIFPIRRDDPVHFPKASAAVVDRPAPARGPDRKSHDEVEVEAEVEERPSLVAGVRVDRLSVVASAMGLASAKDAAADEVRFENVPDVFAVDVDVSELDGERAEDGSPEVEVGGVDEEEAPTAVRLALMSGATLFVDVPKTAMAEMVSVAQLIDLPHGAPIYRRGDPADGLYVVVEGKVDLLLSGANKKLIVAEGSVFGEDALLEGAVRIASTRVNGRMLALCIPKDALDGIVQREAALGDVLFNLLVRRLVTMALQSSPLFTPFDVPTRKELARLFEVRRASAGVVIKQRGKRGDGLYLPLAGEFESDDGTRKTSIPLGTMFGHTSLLSEVPERRTVTVRRESVVLRMSATRFLAFAARFPVALTHLSELAKQPHAF